MDINEKIEVLSRARQRISKPENFLQDCLRNKAHTAFCSRGALIEEITIAKTEWTRIYTIENELIKDLPSNHDVVSYNNNHSHAEVLAMFDTTIKRLKRELVIKNLKESRVALETEDEWEVLELV